MKAMMRFAVSACGALLSLPASAQQPQFLFVVPVEVRNLPPNIEAMHVACDLLYGTPLRTIADRGLGPRSFSVRIAIPQVPASGGGTVGEFVGDVAVESAVMPGFDPAIVTHYWCRLNFVGREGGTDIIYYDVTRPDESPRFPVADGSTLRLETGYQPLRR